MLNGNFSQLSPVYCHTMPLDWTSISIIFWVFILRWLPITMNSSRSYWQHSHGSPITQFLLKWSLAHLPHKYSLIAHEINIRKINYTISIKHINRPLYMWKPSHYLIPQNIYTELHNRTKNIFMRLGLYLPVSELYKLNEFRRDLLTPKKLKHYLATIFSF